jgi:hypothetical protein
LLDGVLHLLVDKLASRGHEDDPAEHLAGCHLLVSQHGLGSVRTLIDAAAGLAKVRAATVRWHRSHAAGCPICPGGSCLRERLCSTAVPTPLIMMPNAVTTAKTATKRHRRLQG